jgi:hypothetical protein
MKLEDVMKLFLKKGKGEGDEKQGSEQPAPAPAPAKETKKKGSWRHHLDEGLHNELNSLVQRTHSQRHAYKRTLKVRDAQLWVALAQMSKRLADIEGKLGLVSEVSDDAAEGTGQEAVGEEESKLQNLNSELQTPEPITPEIKQPTHFITSGQPVASTQKQVPLVQAE